MLCYVLLCAIICGKAGRRGSGAPCALTTSMHALASCARQRLRRGAGVPPLAALDAAPPAPLDAAPPAPLAQDGDGGRSLRWWLAGEFKAGRLNARQVCQCTH